MSNETKAAPAVPVGNDPAWTLAAKVREALDRKACPGYYMDVAVEAVVHNYTPAAPSQEPVTAALRDLVAAVQKEMSPDWICSSYHPHLHSALDTAIAALREKGQV